MLKDKLQRVKLKDLNPAPYNPNEMDVSKRRLLKQSLENDGYIENIVVNDRPWTKEKDLTIVDGHHRVEEMIKSGIEEEDVYIGQWSKDEEKALNLRLRRIRGEADPQKELEIIEELSLKGFDLELAGFDDIELQELKQVYDLPEDEPEFDESIADDIETLKCPKCGYEIPK